MTEFMLYIHIPFCVKKCNYCDFLSFSGMGESDKERYVEALIVEIRETARFLQGASAFALRSIFIGGGTPSILPSDQMRRILDAVREHFGSYELLAEDMDSDSLPVEVTIECNPGTLTRDKLEAYKKMGINRLSIGLQSTDDACLACLGRIHTFAQFQQNYKMAREVGFDNINIDLMSALPDQTLESYRHTLETVLALSPEHISSYSLILEEGTPFYEDASILKKLPDEDTERIMYEETKRLLLEQGYERYEISNYAKAGRESRHNLGYWSDVAYLGLGLGASSYLDCCRFSNETNLSEYVKQPFVPFEKREDYEKLSIEDQMAEYMFLGLRRMKGVSISAFEDRFGQALMDVYGETIEKYEKLHLLERKGDQIALTDAGIDVSNHIFSEFI